MFVPLTRIDGSRAYSKNWRFRGAADVLRGQRIVVHVGVGDIASHHLLAVDIDDRGVVAEQPQLQALERGGVRDLECLGEIRGRVLVGGTGAVTDYGGLVAVAVAELRGAAAPRASIEVQLAPRRALDRPPCPDTSTSLRWR